MAGSEPWSIWDRSFGQTPWEAFEEAAVGWVRHLGFPDALRTRSTGDGGLDVVASDAVAQVKMMSVPVQRPDVQRLRGAAYDQRNVIFFSLSGFSTGAIEFADQSGVALFDVVKGLPHAINDHARALEQAQVDRTITEQASLAAERQAEEARRAAAARREQEDLQRAAEAKRARLVVARRARRSAAARSIATRCAAGLRPIGRFARRVWLPVAAGLLAAGVVLAVVTRIAGWDEPPDWMGGVSLAVWIGVGIGATYFRSRRRRAGGAVRPDDGS